MSGLSRRSLLFGRAAVVTCRTAKAPNPRYRDGVVTPHASFLPMQHEPRQAYANLAKIERELGAYGEGGFVDAVAVRSGTIDRPIRNDFDDDIVRRAFSAGAIRRRIRPLIAMEQFSAGLVGRGG